jgi:hypothetical protein
MSPNLATLTHLVCNILSRLVALDEGDGLLDFQTFFKPVAREYEGTNGPLIIAVMLGGGILEFLVSRWAPRPYDRAIISWYANLLDRSDTPSFVS